MTSPKEYIHIENFDDLKCNDLYCLLHQILRYVKDITSAEAGSIYLLDGNCLKFSIFQNDSFSYEKIDEVQKPLGDLQFELKENSGTLAVESFIMNKMISIDDIYENDDFNFTSAKTFDEKFGYKTTSILTAPLVNYFNDSRIGVLQLVNRQDEHKRHVPFSLKDKEALSLTSHLITLSINAVQESEQEIKKITESIDKKVAVRTQDMKKVQDKLKTQAYTDPLTGLYNRRYFTEITSDIVKNKRMAEKQGAIFILDIDFFKNINDTFGHGVGDKVLINLAKTLKETLRSDDISIRFGGEEFVIFLPNTNKENALFIADKLRMKIEENIIQVSNETKDIRYTASIGIATINNDDQNMNSVLERADKALYKAKKEGKNRVIFN